jgi:hypothetical protein
VYGSVIGSVQCLRQCSSVCVAVRQCTAVRQWVVVRCVQQCAAVCGSALSSVWQCQRLVMYGSAAVRVWQYGSVRLCASVGGSAVCVEVCVAVCGSQCKPPRQCVAVRPVVCGNARSSMSTLRTIVYGSALGSIWQRARQCATVRQCGSVRQCA